MVDVRFGKCERELMDTQDSLKSINEDIKEIQNKIIVLEQESYEIQMKLSQVRESNQKDISNQSLQHLELFGQFEQQKMEFDKFKADMLAKLEGCEDQLTKANERVEILEKRLKKENDVLQVRKAPGMIKKTSPKNLRHRYPLREHSSTNQSPEIKPTTTAPNTRTTRQKKYTSDADVDEDVPTQLTLETEVENTTIDYLSIIKQ